MDERDEPMEEVPRWDVALEALAREEYGRRGQPLTVEDIHRLARQHGIRLDDFVATLFELCIAGRWSYVEPGGAERELTREELEALGGQGRIELHHMRPYRGGWRPR
ncbi:MAG: hypothetical protein D6809_03640 [Gammaproteobacteria bacterium]|nr:MAG: hypothetical protein D6809_03640 [Gammaproteobacteria bacterium]